MAIHRGVALLTPPATEMRGTERPAVRPDPEGNRAQRRAWTRLHGQPDETRGSTMANGEPTGAQLRLLSFLAQGLSRDEMGRAAHVSPATVKTHLSVMYEAIGARNAAHAVAIAYRRKWLPLPGDSGHGA